MSDLKKNLDPILVAHRGGAGLWLENSLPAFNAAIINEYPAIECDIHLTADHQLIIHHDFKINTTYTKIPQTALNSLWISALKSEDLKSLTIFDALNHVYSVPPFVDDLLLLATSSKHRPFLFLEIKTSPEHHTLEHVKRLVDCLFEQIQSFDYMDRITVLSFDWRGLEYAKTRYPNIFITFIYCPAVHEPHHKNPWIGSYQLDHRTVIESLSAIGADVVSVPYDYITKDFIDACVKQGLLINSWTANHLEDIQSLYTLGVHFITTDFPNVKVSV